MKKILFVIPSYQIGGTTVSTRNLVSLLDNKEYDCWVMPLNPHGELDVLYKNVKIITTPYYIRAISANKWNDEKSIIRRFSYGLLRLFGKISSNLHNSLVVNSISRIVDDNGIETIVACQEGKVTKYVSRVKCQNKVAWIRCDYKRYFDKRKRINESFYKYFDSIVCVAKQSYINFIEIYPYFADRVHFIANPQDEKLIKERAEENVNDTLFKKEGINIISVGRFDPIKRFERIAGIASALIVQGLKFKWYLIGDGPEKNQIIQSIKEKKVEEQVILLGVKSNPYYYIKHADVLVCLSSSEACPRVVNEAKILHTPTVSTDFSTIHDFIQNRENGVIASIDNMSEAIFELLTDTSLYSQICNNIKEFTFDNTQLLKELIEIL